MIDLLDQLAAYGRSHEDRQTAGEAFDPQADIHVIELRPKDPGGSMSSRIGVMVGGLAAAMVALFALVFVGGGESDEGDSIAAVPAEIAIVGEFVDALNRHDIDGALALAPDDWRAEFGDVTRSLAVGRAPANPQHRFVEPCETETSPDGRVTATCQLESTNDFEGSAVGPTRATLTATVEADVLVGFEWETREADASRDAEFRVAFWRWLRIERPDAYGSVAPPINRYVPGLSGDPEEMRVVLDHLDAFLAQSDKYPLPEVGD